MAFTLIFLLKKCESLFCKSYSHFSAKKPCELDIVLNRTVQILTTNELVSLRCFEQLVPDKYLLICEYLVVLFCCCKPDETQTTVSSTSFRKSFFAWRSVQKK